MGPKTQAVLNGLLDTLSPETAVARRDEVVRDLLAENQRLEQEVDQLSETIINLNKIQCSAQARRQTNRTRH